MTVLPFSSASTPWTEDRMIDLWCWALDGLSLNDLAEKMKAPASECDLALWSLVGSDAKHAAIVMNRRFR
jgi:hypothetical protein